jgi:hypothetical protein
MEARMESGEAGMECPEAAGAKSAEARTKGAHAHGGTMESAEAPTPIAGRPVVGSTIAPRIRISRFDDENGPCSGFEA